MISSLYSYLDFLSGAGMFAVTAYASLKAKGFTIFSVEKIELGREKIQRLSKSHSELSEIQNLVGNISSKEFTAFLKRANELSAGGFTDEEVLELGMMVIEAAKGK